MRRKRSSMLGTSTVDSEPEEEGNAERETHESK